MYAWIWLFYYLHVLLYVHALTYILQGCQVIDDQNGHNIGQYNVVKFSVDPTTKDVNISYTEGDYNR